MRLARPAVARMLGAFAALVLAVAIGVPLAYWHRVPPWSLAGFSMTLCPCASPCPCRSRRLGPRVAGERVGRRGFGGSVGRVRRRVSILGVLEVGGRVRGDAEGRRCEVVTALDLVVNKIAYADNLAYRYAGPDLPR